MASDDHKPSSPAGRHGARTALLVIAGIAVLLVALGAWLMQTGSGARVAFSLLNRSVGGAMQSTGIQGRLAGPLRIGELRIETASQQILLKDLQFDWRPAELLQRSLHVTLLRIGHLKITSKIEQETEPLRMPDTLALPVKLHIDQVQVDAGSIGWGPVNVVELGGFAFNLDFDGARYQLGLDRLAVRSLTDSRPVTGDFSGKLTLGATPPFAVNGEVSSGAEANIEQRTVGARGRIGLNGSLAELVASIDLAVTQAKATAQVRGGAVLKPFSDQALGNANLEVAGLDLAALAPGLPGTQLDLRLAVGADGNGDLTLSNPQAGMYNERKLPLASLRMRLRQSAGKFYFDDIVMALGSAARPAGTVTGNGSYSDGAVMLALETRALDLQRVDKTLRQTRLAGNVTIRHAGGKQEFTIALSEPLKKNSLMLSAHALLADTGLSVDRAELRLGEARINLSGHAGLTDRQTFSAEGRVSRFRLQDLGDFPQLPALDLNGNFSVRGARAPQLTADLAFRIADSRLSGQPLQGDGQAQLRGDRINVPNLLLRAGANQLTLQGELSQKTSRLTFALNAPQLEQLGPGFSGAIDLNGSARGTMARPHISAEWKASRVRIPAGAQIDTSQGKADIDIDRANPLFIDAAAIEGSARGVRSGTQQLAAISARMRFGTQPSAPLALELDLQEMSSGELRAEQATLRAHGTSAQHVIDLTVREPQQGWALKATGGLRDLARAPQWQGTIDRVDASGRFTARLAAPAPVSISAQRIQLSRFRLEASAALVDVAQFLREPDRIVTRGRVERLDIAQVLKFVSPAPALGSDLVVDGEWDVNIADTISGSINARRRHGDIVMRGDAPVALGLNRLEASASASNGQITLQLAADGRQLGHIDINASTRMSGGVNRFSIAPGAALSGTARIDVPSIAWAGPLISPTLSAEGRVQSAVALGGTFAAPRLTGQVNGSELRFFFSDLGVDLRQGVLESEFRGTELLVTRLRFQSGDGQLQMTGPIDLASGKPAAQLVLEAGRYPLLNRPDRKLVISGRTQVMLAEGKAKINGKFAVDSGFFDIGRQGAPQLSDDVVIVGRAKKSSGQIAAALDVGISLGEGVSLKGRGIDATLQGEVRLVSAGGEPPQAQGTLKVTKGTYTAYGRALVIEQGLLRFTGPINNPALDILAMRRGQEVEAGVSVRGTVLAPRVTLVSEPSVPDAEKLSWLVLGSRLNAAGGADLGALQSAAGALLADSAAAGVQSQLATAFGLDTLSLSTSNDTLQQRIITLGKQISSRLYVSYQQGLQTATSAVLLRYTLTPRLTIEAEAGTRSVLSLFYNIAFD
ncbi:MAG: hypothetical protein JWQ23_4249 [Herminiimonas sp.]|nr:hypothetical protein [Herminiimonas sp.]